MKPPPRAVAVLLAVLLPALLAALAWLLYMGRFRVDDAFIVYRYAENLADGRGIVFNPGQRVEGVTCLLWVFVLAPLGWLPVPLHVSAPIVSAVAGLVLLLLLPGFWPAAAREGWHVRVRWLPVALLLGHPGFAHWAGGALETVPYTLLLVLCLRSYLHERQAGGAGMRSAVWGGLATWMRPEAPMLLGAIALDMLMVQPRPWRRILRWGLVVGAFPAALLLFRLAYFGDWLPNTYYAKTGGPLWLRLYSGLGYSFHFFGSLVPGYPAYPRAASVLGTLLVAALLLRGLLHPLTRPLALLVGLLAATTVYSGGDWMVMGRFWVPALPFLLLQLTLLGAARVRCLTGLAVVLGASWLVWGLHQRCPQDGSLHPSRAASHVYREVAQFLGDSPDQEAPIALMDIGQIGYESGRKIIDITGLVTPWVAKSPGAFLDKTYPVEALLGQQPEYVVLRPGYRIDQRILDDPGFRSQYRMVLERPLGGGWIQVYARGRRTTVEQP